jgi:hypothetical protein
MHIGRKRKGNNPSTASRVEGLLYEYMNVSLQETLILSLLTKGGYTMQRIYRLNLRTPLALAMVGAAIWLRSPEVRQMGRELLEKGTVASLRWVDQIKDRWCPGQKGVEDLKNVDLSAFDVDNDTPDDWRVITYMIESMQEQLNRQQEEIKRLRKEMMNWRKND